MSEAKLQREIMLAISKTGARGFRNNVGTGWVGTRIIVNPKIPALYGNDHTSNVLILGARPLHAGLSHGSSDIISIVPTLITEQMVNSTLGVFSAIEVKSRVGRVTEQQQNFINAINQLGGRAGAARSIDDALAIINGTRLSGT